jgi:hypothetical protein
MRCWPTAQRLSLSGAEVPGGGENGPISRQKAPSNGGPECRYDASLAANHEIQASLIGKYNLKYRCYVK